MAVRRGHFHGLQEDIARALGVTQVTQQRAFGARVILVAESEVDIVLHVTGSPREWDTCALQVIVEEAGGVMVNCLGDRPRYLKEDLVQPHGTIVTGAALAERVLGTVTPMYRRERGLPS